MRSFNMPFRRKKEALKGAESHYNSQDSSDAMVFVAVLVCFIWFCWFYQFVWFLSVCFLFVVVFLVYLCGYIYWIARDPQVRHKTYLRVKTETAPSSDTSEICLGKKKIGHDLVVYMVMNCTTGLFLFFLQNARQKRKKENGECRVGL